MTGMASKERITKEAVGDISEDFKARIVIAACSSPETKDGGFDNAQERGEGRSGSPSVRASPTRSEERSESQEGGSNPPPYSKTHELWQETSLVVNAERPPSSLKAKCSKTPTDPDSPHYGVSPPNQKLIVCVNQFKTHGNDFGYTLPVRQRCFPYLIADVQSNTA